MKKMVCEICGSKKLKKDNESFFCKECGTEYSIEEAKKLFQEINETVTDKRLINISDIKDINHLTETGWKIIENFPIDKSNFKLLSDIKDKILLVDFENEDARLFQCMMEISDETPHLEHITEIFELNNQKITEILAMHLIEKAQQSLTALFMIKANDTLYYYNIEAIGNNYIMYLAPLKNNYEKLNENQKKEYEDLVLKIKNATEHVIGLVYETISCFVFTRDSVNSFEFINDICKLISRSYIFIHHISKYFDDNVVKETCKNIYNVIIKNAKILLTSANGKFVLEYAAKLAGIDEQQAKSEINNIGITVTGCLSVGNPITLVLYGNRAVVSGVGPERNIMVENIIKINFQSVVGTEEYSDKILFVWDLVYKLDNSTYTIIQFGYVKVLETLDDCTQCTQREDIFEWCVRIGIDLSYEKYVDENPFTNGIGSYKYVDTLEQYRAKSSSTKSGGCYIATCVYGSYDCPEVWTLRRYRDYKLNKTWLGRLFIKTYYAVSPTLVKLFGSTTWFKKICKCKLDKMIDKYKAKGFDDTPYHDI